MASTRDQMLTEVVRRALLSADFDDVATAIESQFGEPVEVHGISAHASETEPNTIYVVFEGDRLSKKKRRPKPDQPLYLGIKIRAGKDD